MKKTLLTVIAIMIVSFVMISLSFADPAVVIDTTDEVQPTITDNALEYIVINGMTKTAKIHLVKGYYDSGDFVSLGKSKIMTIQNVEDDPETAEDESTTDYDDFLVAIEVDIVELKTYVENNL